MRRRSCHHSGRAASPGPTGPGRDHHCPRAPSVPRRRGTRLAWSRSATSENADGTDAWYTAKSPGHRTPRVSASCRCGCETHKRRRSEDCRQLRTAWIAAQSDGRRRPALGPPVSRSRQERSDRTGNYRRGLDLIPPLITSGDRSLHFPARSARRPGVAAPRRTSRTSRKTRQRRATSGREGGATEGI